MDGEGSVLLTKHNKSSRFRYPAVSMSSTTEEFIDFMVDNHGGYKCNHKIYKSHHKPSWTWELIYDKAINFLTYISPFLLDPIKKARADHILTNYKKVTVRNGKYTENQLKEKLKFEEDFFLL